MVSARATLAYFDHAATAPMRREAIEAMRPYLDEQFANPSGSHRFSRAARQVVDEARDDVADVLGCAPGEVVFTSGGTEADNAAVFGAVRRHGGVAVCSAAEHHAVLHCVEHLGGEVVDFDRCGVIDLEKLHASVAKITSRNERTALVSVMSVNNEVGSVTPMQLKHRRWLRQRRRAVLRSPRRRCTGARYRAPQRTTTRRFR
ncbi:MAG: aminotransferase class V-fold PLP-dependent enzyme, partial [Actinomycetota bacterium]